jgi:hypothetical protein
MRGQDRQEIAGLPKKYPEKGNGMNFTKNAYRALTIIEENGGGIDARTFAEKYYPDSELWQVTDRRGKKAGYKIIDAGRAYLKRLTKHQWLTYHKAPMFTYQYKEPGIFKVTELGKAKMRAYNQSKSQ